LDRHVFDAKKQWGPNHAAMFSQESRLAEDGKIFQSTNHTKLQWKQQKVGTPVTHDKNNTCREKKKSHVLSSCLWAAKSFKMRGVHKESGMPRDTKDQLKESIEFHLMVGFDHIYIYDNIGTHNNEMNLTYITCQYPSSKVTHIINWPSLVCNNNIPAHDNTGERSSQYAAENSC
jgi:hypothetical protein